jgi:hypothetical protein
VVERLVDEVAVRAVDVELIVLEGREALPEGGEALADGLAAARASPLLNRTSTSSAMKLV